MTIEHDGRLIVEIPGTLLLDPIDQVQQFTWYDEDVEGTWTGALATAADADAEAPTVTVTATYSAGTGNTTVDAELVGSELVTLRGTSRVWEGVLEVSRSDAPIRGIRVAVRIGSVVTQ